MLISLFIGLVIALAALAEWQWRRKIERVKWRLWVLEFQSKFPRRCPVCSFTRWGKEMGISAAYDPVEEHYCPETLS